MQSTTKPVNVGDKVPLHQQRFTRGILVRAENARQVGEGTWELEIVSRDLTPAESTVLADLFPHSERQVEELLTREALLNAIVMR